MNGTNRNFTSATLFLVLQAVAFSAEPTALDVLTKTLSADDTNFLRLRNYLFSEEKVERELDRGGKAKKTESTSYEVFYVDGARFSRVVARNGKPLSDRDKAKEDKKLLKIQERAREDPKKRERTLQEERKKRREFLVMLPEVFTFTHLGGETIDGRATYKIDATPKPGYKSRNKQSELLHKMKGVVWIDKDEFQIVKADVSIIEPVSFGWFIAKLEKGATIDFQQTRVNDEVWLPKLFFLSADVRLLGAFRGLEQKSRMSNYRKFQTDAQVVSVSEIEQ